MSALLLLFGCLILGIVVARFADPPQALPHSLNWWVLNIALPAIVVRSIPNLQFEWRLWFLVASMWFVFLGAWAVMAVVGSWRNWSNARIGALTLTCGLGNTSFIGFPILEALRGEEALRLAVVADQLGCFIALAVGGSIVATFYSGASARPAAIARRVLLFPPFLALLTGCIVGAIGSWPPLIDASLARIGATLSPLALFSVGLRLQLPNRAADLEAIVVGLGWKLALAPALVLGCGVLWQMHGEVLRVSVLEAAMAPMISAAILAEQYDLEPHLANTIMGVGILLSMLTVPLLNWMF
jgi:predicted permease